MKKLIKDWWPVLLIAVVMLLKKTKRRSGKENIGNVDVEDPGPSAHSGGLIILPDIDWQHQAPFNGGACVYGPPEMYQNNN